MSTSSSTASTAEVASTAAVAATLTTTSTTSATATAATTTGTLRLDEARVEIEGLLDLALTLTLLLSVATGDEVFVVGLLEGLGASPLLVELATFVGLTDLEAGINVELLLSLLGKVIGEGHALVLGLGGLFASGIFGKGVLLLGLSNSFTSLLVLQLSVAFSGAPRLGSLLLGTTTISQSVEYNGGYLETWSLAIRVNTGAGGVAVIVLTGTTRAAA